MWKLMRASSAIIAAAVDSLISDTRAARIGFKRKYACVFVVETAIEFKLARFIQVIPFYPPALFASGFEKYSAVLFPGRVLEG